MPRMTRDLEALTDRTFDVLVVGGGIYGLAIAYDAAQRGLAVALVERQDFGSGTSFNHLRTIHGGLRYLQSLDVARARESVRERRTIARIAPHAVRPLPSSRTTSRRWRRSWTPPAAKHRSSASRRATCSDRERWTSRRVSRSTRPARASIGCSRRSASPPVCRC